MRKVGEVVGVGAAAAVGVVVARAALARARTTNQDLVKDEEAGVQPDSYDDILSRIDKMRTDCKQTNPSNILNQLMQDTDRLLDGDGGKLHTFSRSVREDWYPYNIQTDIQYLTRLRTELVNAYKDNESIQPTDITLVNNIENMSQNP